MVYDHPALVHPGTGVVFGYAQGTHSYALRLTEPELGEMRAAGAKPTYVYPSVTLDLSGAEGWLFGTWHPDEPRWCLAAYEAAGGERQNTKGRLRRPS